MNTLYTSHSCIPTYPPNVTDYPDFYKCKEHTFILKPGDMLYIPAGWFHWVFSYPDEQQNIAISYTVSELNGDIYNEFQFKKPYKFHLNKNEHPFFNYTFNTFKKMYPTQKIHTLISNKNTLVPVKKQTLKNTHNLITYHLTFSEMHTLLKNNTHNIYMGQNDSLHPQRPPECILRGFPTSKFRCNQWLALFKTNTEYIDSGLHYDITHGILIQVKGTKLIRLFRPQDANNLYLQPMYKLN
jgi:hypothetical protein